MTVSDLHDDLARIGAPLMVRAGHDFAAGRITPQPQPADGVTYAAKLARDEGRIDWAQPAVAIDRAVRALNPGPGTFRSEARRVGEECVSTCRSRWVPDHLKKKTTPQN